MKRNLWFKLGLFCTALVLVATCFITSAWAKYTKSVTASDSARVAKFEVSMKQGETVIENNTTIDIFGTKFNNIAKDDNGNNVKTDKLIAPGSHGKTTIKVSNSGEVAVRFTATAIDTNTASIPLIFKVTGDTNEYTTFKAAVEAAFADVVIGVGGTEVSKEITWEWKYDAGRDTEDTNLGVTGTAKYEVNLTVTATQVQPAE